MNYLKAFLFFISIGLIAGCDAGNERELQNQEENREQNSLEQIQGEPEFSEAVAVLNPTEGSNVRGKVTFTKVDEGIKVVADVEGLTPGKHGFHIHEFGDCSAPDAASAGGHFNPEEDPHAGPHADQRHTGDMGNLEAGQDGKAHLEYVDKHMSFTGANSIIGRGVIVHEKEDDLTSQPTGNAGGRVACGVVGISKM